MKRLIVSLALTAFVVAPLAAQSADQQLIDRAATDVQGKPAVEDANVREARVEATLAAAKLELAQARKASRANEHLVAVRHASTVLGLLDSLPNGNDAAGDYELQAEGILARAARFAGKAQPRDARVAGEQVESQPADAGLVRHDNRAPQAVKQGYSGGRSRYITTSIGTGVGSEGSMIDVEAIADVNDFRERRYQADLADAYKSDEMRRLIEADEARVAPESDVSHPENWREISEKRDQYKGGLVARSKPWQDKDGREWHAAIYDISSLTYVPPDFQPPFSLDPVEDLRNTLDRQALRDRSQIFGGYADDLATGIPLLRAFGGFDDYVMRGPKYSEQRARDIVEMIKAVSTPSNEAKVIMLGP
ncbi:MAG: hypothetical protein ACKVS9_18560 [Phycisphaerae bacterium]